MVRLDVLELSFLFPVDPSGDCIRVLCWDTTSSILVPLAYLIALCGEHSDVSFWF